MKNIRLSIIVVTGKNRGHAQEVMDALAAQTAVHNMEVLCVDLADEGVGDLVLCDEPDINIVKLSQETSLGRARYEGFIRSKGPFIAFLEDHCVPEPGWADAVLNAFEGPWAAVGFAFQNGSPDHYKYRATLIAEYGPWAYPTSGGQVSHLPGGNLSYRRDVLPSAKEELEAIFTCDFFFQEDLTRCGKKLYLEEGAIVSHRSNRYFKDTLRGHFFYSRLLGGKRVDLQSWGWVKRLTYAAAVSFLLPALQLIRIFRESGDRPVLRKKVVATMPVILTTHISASLGEAVGYIFGKGESERCLDQIELNAERIGRT